MSDFGAVRGFEDVWRPVARGKRVGDHGVVSPGRGGSVHARLTRLAQRAPEVMVKITGRTRDAGHLQAHLAYICRDGALPLEGRDGERLVGMAEVWELGSDWAAEDLRRRRDASLSLSVVLSMPAGTGLSGLRDAVRTFAAETFGERHDYVFALHTDVDHPHVHLSVRLLGEGGERLNPRKADLEVWRQTFARTLRDRDIPAEATLRRARGLVRKAEAMPVRKLRERHEAGRAPMPRVLLAARDEALRIAKGELQVERPWEAAILRRQRTVRQAYLHQADALARSGSGEALGLSESLRAFVAAMPVPTTRRNDLVRAARESIGAGRDEPAPAREVGARRHDLDHERRR